MLVERSVDAGASDGDRKRLIAAALTRGPELFAAAPIDLNDRTAPLDAVLSVCQGVKIAFLWCPNLPDERGNPRYVSSFALKDRPNSMVARADFAEGGCPLTRIRPSNPSPQGVEWLVNAYVKPTSKRFGGRARYPQESQGHSLIGVYSVVNPRRQIADHSLVGFGQ